jgi:hypothetical protein
MLRLLSSRRGARRRHEALKSAFHDGKLNFHGDLKLLAQPKTFAAWLRPLFRKDWVVYSKRPFGGPEHGLRYLGGYTHRVAISNHRLVSFADGRVTFRWRDSAHNNEQKWITYLSMSFCAAFCCGGVCSVSHHAFLEALPFIAFLLSKSVSSLGPSERSRHNTARPFG